MTTRVRRAEPRDVNDIQVIDGRVYSSPWSRQMTIDQVTGADRLHVVVESNGRLAGHAGLLFLADEAHVSTIAVDPSAHRQGHGRALLLVLARAACHAGSRGLTLEVRAGNTAALALYRSFGLAPVGARRGYYADTGEDALILWSPPIDGSADAWPARLDSIDWPDAIELSPELQRLAGDLSCRT